MYPGDVIAFARADGHDGREAVEELTRVVEDHNFRGLKQSFNVKASDPAIFPLVEKTIDLRIPILFHAFMDRERRPDRLARNPNETSALELVQLARRYPEAMIVMAHYNLGDWEFGLKAVRDTPNIYPSTGGSGLAAGYIEAGVRELNLGERAQIRDGPDRGKAEAVVPDRQVAVPGVRHDDPEEGAAVRGSVEHRDGVARPGDGGQADERQRQRL